MTVALVLTLALLTAGVEPAAAHAIVLESVPANETVLARSPERVTLRFNSKLEKRLTRVTLGSGRAMPRPLSIAHDRDTADAGPDRIVIPLDPLPPGRYIIRYKVLSADGHVTQGALRFSVSSAP
jgi:methionine-rich copper-binding protein CopC